MVKLQPLGRPVDCLNWIDEVGHCISHSFFFFAKVEDQSLKPVIRPIPLNYILILMLCYTSPVLYNVQCSVHILGPVASCAGNYKCRWLNWNRLRTNQPSALDFKHIGKNGPKQKNKITYSYSADSFQISLGHFYQSFSITWTSSPSTAKSPLHLGENVLMQIWSNPKDMESIIRNNIESLHWRYLGTTTE